MRARSRRVPFTGTQEDAAYCMSFVADFYYYSLFAYVLYQALLQDAKKWCERPRFCCLRTLNLLA
jgi:hypothetical protein